MASNALLDAVAATRTSNGWSLLKAILPRVQKRLPEGHEPATVRSVCAALDAATEDERRRRGVWRQGRGEGTVVCVNPSYAAARARGEQECTCGTAARAAPDFSSHAYNAGRHACTASAHVASCVEWRPPLSGHLHSWRRAYG